MVRERGGTPFRQISLATGGTLTLKRSGKSRRTPWVDPRTVYFLAQKCHQTRNLALKNLKKFSGGDTHGPLQQEGAIPSALTPSTAIHAVRGGASSPVAGT